MTLTRIHEWCTGVLRLNASQNTLHLVAEVHVAHKSTQFALFQEKCVPEMQLHVAEVLTETELLSGSGSNGQQSFQKCKSLSKTELDKVTNRFSEFSIVLKLQVQYN